MDRNWRFVFLIFASFGLNGFPLFFRRPYGIKAYPVPFYFVNVKSYFGIPSRNIAKMTECTVNIVVLLLYPKRQILYDALYQVFVVLFLRMMAYVCTSILTGDSSNDVCT